MGNGIPVHEAHPPWNRASEEGSTQGASERKGLTSVGGWVAEICSLVRGDLDVGTDSGRTSSETLGKSLDYSSFRFRIFLFLKITKIVRLTAGWVPGNVGSSFCIAPTNKPPSVSKVWACISSSLHPS